MMKFVTEEFPEIGQEMMDVALKRKEKIIESKLELESALSALSAIESAENSTSLREPSIMAERIVKRRKTMLNDNRIVPMF